MSDTTIDERMDRWLNDEADARRVPDEERQRFMDAMRETTSFAVARLGYTCGDLLEASRVRWLVTRINRWMDRRDRSGK